MTVAAAVAAVAPVGREEKHGSYVDVDEYHRHETVVAVAAAAAEACHRRETSVAVAAAAVEACHRREISVAVTAAAAAEACPRREIPYGHPFVGLRLPRPPRPENHGLRQEYGGSMDVPGTGGE